MCALVAACSPGTSEVPRSDAPVARDSAHPADNGKEAAVKPDLEGPDKGPPAPTSIKVLFLGNSLTFTNDLPQWVARVAKSSGKAPSITTEANTAVQTLAQHLADTATQSKIKTGGWSYVVIQGQSVGPVTNYSSFLSAGKELAAKIKKAGAVPVFFETWAYKKGAAIYSMGGDPASMQKILRDAYQAVFKASPGSVYAPVGDAWEAALAQHPSLELFGGDDHHPGVNGTYLSACVLMEVLTNHSPVGVQDKPAGLSAAQAKSLQTVAHDTVKKN